MAKTSSKSTKTDNSKKLSNYEVGKTSKNRKQREDEKIEKKGMPKVIVFFIILIIVGVSIGVLFSPAFNLEELIADDGKNITSSEISNIANVKYGENILKQNYKSIKNSILKLPYIKDVKLKLIIPNKIKIEYIERIPYALVKYLESYFVVDQNGYVLEVCKDTEKFNLPIIYGIDIDTYELGETLTDTARIKYKNIMTLLEIAKQKEFAYNIYEINYTSISEVRFWVEGYDIDILYGDIDKNIISDKLAWLESTLERLKGKKGELNISSDNYLEKTIFTERYD